MRIDAAGSQSGPAFTQGATFGDPTAGNREQICLVNPDLTSQARGVITSQLLAAKPLANITDATRFSIRKNPVDLGIRDPVVHALNRRLAAATGTGVGQGEPLQVSRYAPGQQYRRQSDALPNEPNQRLLTVLVYLNVEYEGGRTHFAAPDIAVRGGVGDALVFRNVDAMGRPDPRARHAGQPVTRGVKLLASKWIRGQPLQR